MSLLEPQMKGSPYQNEIALDDFSGWHSLSPELWVYFSADAPSFVVEIDSTSDIFTPGMRVRLKQDSGKQDSGVYKYFGINKVEITTKTYLTLYGGTSFTLANETITEVAVSNAKAPYGFPLEESYWSVVVSDANDRTQSSPVALTWYNLDPSHKIDLPVGAWKVSFDAVAGGANTSLAVSTYVTLSTANNSESDVNNTVTLYYTTGSATAFTVAQTVSKSMLISVLSKTSYYLNVKHNMVSMTSIGLYGTQQPIIIRAVWAYL